MLTLPPLTDRQQNETNAARAESIRTLNWRIRVTNRYIARLMTQRDNLIAERAGLLQQAELDAVRELVELTAGEPIRGGQAGGDELPVVQLHGDVFGGEDPERWDGMA